MKSKLHLGRGAAILACAASLAGTAIGVAPTAASAAGTSCGTKSIKVPVEGGKPVHVKVQAISVEGGATCAEAAKVIGGVLAGKPPSGWKSVTPHYELPKNLAEEGLFPQLVKKGSKKVKYAIHGG
ncbi:MAG TPA: hypothetical protein VHB53_11940 [Solirubrobacterales bacterium]|nr:hypothetical protein [Solirubrobacterales bacterium]